MSSLDTGSPRKPEKTARFGQSLCWWCFHEKVEPRQLVEEAVAMGFAAVEIAPREYWGMIADHNLRIVATGGHTTFEDGLNRRENHARIEDELLANRIEDELLANIDLAVEHDIPILICFSGNRRGLGDEEGIENTAEGLLKVAKVAEEKGTTLCVELLNSKVDHPDYQCDHTSWGVEVCKRVGSPAVKLLYDIYHMQIMEGDLIRTIQQNIEYIGHFHTAGNPGRRDLDDAQEINYRGIARAIADTGYSGYVAHEFTPKGDAIQALRQAFEIFDI
jgi:hydroxypyruvate isomerase